MATSYANGGQLSASNSSLEYSKKHYQWRQMDV